MRPLAIALLTGALALGACAKSADEIPATYVSPLAYRDYSCDQLGAELSRVNARAAEVAGLQDEAASDDETIMGVGLVLFWPALFSSKATPAAKPSLRACAAKWTPWKPWARARTARR